MAHARESQASPLDGGYFYLKLGLRQDPGEFPGSGMRTASFPEQLASALPPGIPGSTVQALGSRLGSSPPCSTLCLAPKGVLLWLPPFGPSQLDC